MRKINISLTIRIEEFRLITSEYRGEREEEFCFREARNVSARHLKHHYKQIKFSQGES